MSIWHVGALNKPSYSFNQPFSNVSLNYHFILYPVHGGWSSWSAWGGCPVTCGGSLERRDRTCTNPRPALFGDHCFGDNHEIRICATNSCITASTSG